MKLSALEMSRAQVEQNFILMRQNEEIIRLLKQLQKNNFLLFCTYCHRIDPDQRHVFDLFS